MSVEVVGMNTTQISEHFTITGKGLEITGKPKYEDYEYGYKDLFKKYEQASMVRYAIQLCIGDLLNHAEDNPEVGQMAYQLVGERDWRPGYIANIKSVSSKIPFSHRCDSPYVTFSHYQAIAPAEPQMRPKYVQMVMEGQLSVSEIKEIVKQDKESKKQEKEETECEHNYVRYCTKCKEMIV